MAFPQKAYSRALAQPELAIPVDLTSGDWTVPYDGINEQVPCYTTKLYIGIAGDLVVGMAGDPATKITFKAHPAGYTEFSIATVYQSGTTAQNIVALF